MTSDAEKYWFPAKRYGWGWGTPSCWQGWVVLLGFVTLSTLGPVLCRPPEHVVMLVVYEVILTGVLVLVCWKKGEPPRWRWGDPR